MPAGLRVSALNPSYADAGSFRTPAAELNPMDRLNAAFKEGILTYDEIVKGLTVKPRQNQKDVLTLDDQINEQKWRTENASGLNVLRANQLKQQTAEGDIAAQDAEAKRAAIAEQPDFLKNQARKKLTIADTGLDVDQMKLDQLKAREKELQGDTHGLKDFYINAIRDAGLPVDPNWTVQEAYVNYLPAYKELETRAVNAWKAKAIWERYPKEQDREDALAKEFRSDYNQNSVIKDHPAIISAAEKIKAGLAVKKPSAISDHAIIFNYLHMMDNSTVRESEFAAVRNAKAILQRITDFPEQFTTGRFLNDDQLKEIKDSTERTLAAHEDAVDRVESHFRETARIHKLDPKLVIGSGWRDHRMPATPAAPETPPTATPPPSGAAPSAPATPPVAAPAVPVDMSLPPGIIIRRFADGTIHKTRNATDGRGGYYDLGVVEGGTK